MAITEIANLGIDEIESPCGEYLDYLIERRLPYALMHGTKYMRQMGKEYLPQEEAESDIAYNNRLKRTFLLNIYKRTVKKLSGTVFSKPIIVNTEDEDIRNLLFDFDFEGNNINVVSFRFFSEAIAYGVSHIFVDYPDVDLVEKNNETFILDNGKAELLSRKKEKELNLRPFCNIIPASNIIGWKYGKINGVKRLIEVRIKDKVSFPDGKYREIKKDRIRILRPGEYETYIKDKEYTMVSFGKTGLNYIPLFSFFTGEERNGLVCDFPLEDLAYLNLEHWQSSSDQRNVLHYARLITFLGISLDDVIDEKKIVIGCNQIVHSSDPNGDLKVVEHSGRAIKAGSDDLRQLEKQMYMFGLSITDNKVSRETATSRMIDSLEANSTLKNWALNFNDVLNNIIECMAEYIDKKDFNKSITEDIPDYVKVNTDINPSFGGDSVSTLLAAYNSGVIDKENLLIEFKRRGVLREGANIKNIISKTEDQTEDQTKDN